MRPVYILGSPSQNLVVIPPNSSTFWDCRKTWHVPCALCHGRATCHGRNTCHGSKFPNNNLNFRLASNVVMLLETTTNLCASPIIFSWEVWQNAKSLTPLETVSFVSPRTQCFQQSSLIPLEPVNQRLKSLGFHDFYEQIYPFVTLTLVISSSCLCL